MRWKPGRAKRSLLSKPGDVRHGVVPVSVEEGGEQVDVGFVRIAVVGGHVGEDGILHGASVVTSCGGCRQSILEAAQLSGRDIEVVSANGDGTETRVDRISELIPHGFGPANLKDAE